MARPLRIPPIFVPYGGILAGLILDDFGLQTLEIQGRFMLLGILDDRQGIKSIVIVSQLPVSSWHEVIGDKTIADAICDRMKYTAYPLEMKGDSVRKRYSQTRTKPATSSGKK